MKTVGFCRPAAAEPVTMSLDEDARWLDWVTKQFESIAGDDKEIDIDEFKTALKVKEVRKYSYPLEKVPGQQCKNTPLQVKVLRENSY